MAPSGNWKWEPRDKVWARFDASHDCWVNERGKRSRTPPANSPEAPPRRAAGDAARPRGESPQRRPSEATREAALVEQFRDAQLQDNPAAATKAVRRIAEDSRTGLKTHWEIGPTRKYIHPKTKQWRDFNELRIRKGSDGNAHRVSRSMRASTEPRLVIKPGRAIGKIISTPVVQSRRDVSAQSTFTATALSTDGRDRVRPRRFAVVAEHTGNRNTFFAVPLKTYNGHGVANQIKSLHAPIYSSRSGPEYLKSEELSYFDGRLEDPMEKPAIWVRPYNRDTELDGYSRLDYFECIEFDFDDPLVVLFGKVDDNSYDPFLAQWRRVRAHIMDVLHHSTSSGSIEASARRAQQRTTTTPAVGISIKNTAATAGSSSTSAAVGRGRAGTTKQADPVAAVEAALARLQQYANHNDLEWPATITRAGREKMAQDPALLKTSLLRIRDNLKEQMRVKHPEALSSEEEGGEESDEEEQDD